MSKEPKAKLLAQCWSGRLKCCYGVPERVCGGDIPIPLFLPSFALECLPGRFPRRYRGIEVGREVYILRKFILLFGFLFHTLRSSLVKFAS
jgi:hypothetical protein